MEELISVIVPINNSEKYLYQCLESIIAQTYYNLEIVLVDDCSDDNSGKICDEFAEKDTRVHVIHRETKGGEGGAKARNTGIDYATGEVLYFIDSDDYIDSDMLAQMYAIMYKEKSDCVVSSFHYVDAEGQELPWRTPEITDYGTMSGHEAAGIYLTTLNIEGFSWNKLIRRDVIEKYEIRFDESMNSFVDMYGMFRTVLNSNKVSFYNAKPYYYRQLDTSCVHTIDRRKLSNFKKVICQIAGLAKENNMAKESDFFYIYRMVLQLFDAIKGKENYEQNSWREIRQEYQWNRMFGVSLWKAYRLLFAYIKKDRLKTAIKLVTVWSTFI